LRVFLSYGQTVLTENRQKNTNTKRNSKVVSTVQIIALKDSSPKWPIIRKLYPFIQYSPPWRKLSVAKYSRIDRVDLCNA